MKSIFCSILIVSIFATSSQTPVVSKGLKTSKVPALESLHDVLEEASQDLGKKGEGRKSLDQMKDMEKRLKEIQPLEEAIWSRAQKLANSSSATRRTSKSKSRSITISSSANSNKRLKKLCIIRMPGP